MSRVARRVPTLNEILEVLESYITWLDEIYAHWRCGITSDPQSAERESRSVGTDWRCLDAGSELNARQIEILLRRMGCQAVPHPGGVDTCFIYVYRILSGGVR